MRFVQLFSYFSTLSQFLLADNFQFTVILKEQASKKSDTDQKYLILSTNLACGNQNCDYSVNIDNYSNTFFKVLVNNHECPNSNCINVFHQHQVVNVTVHKIATGEYLEIIDLEFERSPKIVILGCEVGYYNDGQCTKVNETVNDLDEPKSFYDEVCVCASSQTQYCDERTADGTW
uniref:CW domain-containing protein n=1 Tax=Caenorhabditis tropicalis TaxID=1561998 RepID=A0A1I7TYZ6_9PELO